jgi:outer membrane protein OmpA-like peptidoglycan-associated protein
MAHRDGPVRVDLLTVDRSAASTVTVRWRLTNGGQRPLDPAGSMESWAFHPVSTVDGVSLVDVAGHKRYFPLRNTTNECLCSTAAHAKIDPGRAREFFAVFASPPAQVRRVTVAVPLTPAFLDVPIGTAVRSAGAGERDPATERLKNPPPIVPLINTVEGAESSVDEDAQNRSVRLSADVLFAYNKAELAGTAQSVLGKVATQIDASTGSTVTVDGYTDDTGNDAVNDPLSQRRAQAVRSRLEALVTRRGVTFRAAGHGSRDPVADNRTPEGRQKNRRVTVTFLRPQSAPERETPPSVLPPARRTDGRLSVVGTLRPQPVPGHLDTSSLQAEINELHRSTSGAVQLLWTLRNNGHEDLRVALWFKGDLWSYTGEDTSGVVLRDTQAQQRYNPLRDTAKGCLCTVTTKGKNTLRPGESVTFFALYELPGDLSEATVKVPGFAQSERFPIR